MQQTEKIFILRMRVTGREMDTSRHEFDSLSLALNQTALSRFRPLYALRVNRSLAAADAHEIELNRLDHFHMKQADTARNGPEWLYFLAMGLWIRAILYTSVFRFLRVAIWVDCLPIRS